MKTLLLSFIISVGMAACANAGNKAETAIRNTIIEFAKAGDANDVTKLDQLLDPNYRIVMNRLFGSTEVMVMDKNTYLSKIETKEWGGDKRKVEITGIMLNDNSATAIVNYTGEKASFKSVVLLVNDGKGIWTLVSETPKM